MKLKPMLLTSLFAGVFSLSLSTFAASDMDKPEMTETTGSQPAGQAEAAKMHSHVQEKTGMPQKMPEAQAAKPKAIPASDKHYHPRDGK